MKLNFNDPNPGVFFPFNDDNPDAGGVCLRVLPMDELKRIEKATTKKRIEYKKGQRFEVLTVDNELKERLVFDYMITDWPGLTEDNGDPIECDADNKVRAMNKFVKFANFVSSRMEMLEADSMELKASAEKN